MISLDSIAGVIGAIAMLAGTPGVVAWMNRRQLRDNVGDTTDTNLIERLDGIEGKVDELVEAFAEHLEHPNGHDDEDPG